MQQADHARGSCVQIILRGYALRSLGQRSVAILDPGAACAEPVALDVHVNLSAGASLHPVDASHDAFRRFGLHSYLRGRGSWRRAGLLNLDSVCGLRDDLLRALILVVRLLDYAVLIQLLLRHAARADV